MEFVQLASTVDRWESGEALRDLRSSKNKKLHHVVCTWNSSGGDNTTSTSDNAPDICALAGNTVDRVIDSGASFHVMNPQDMTSGQKKKIKPTLAKAIMVKEQVYA